MIIKYLIKRKEKPMKHKKINMTINQIKTSIFETIWAIGITVASNAIQKKYYYGAVKR